MKYSLAFLFTFALFLNVQAQNKGIKFQKGDWQTILDKAQEEDKIIFVDAYTTWCGPCKWMNANVFTDKAVGDFYNDQFINVKLDMEKGEGITFAEAYQVTAYPTLFFINGKGEMLHKGLGGRAPQDFIGLGQAAIDPDRQIGSLSRKYEEGNKDPKVLQSYAAALSDGGMPGASKIAAEYLENQKDWNTEENMNFIFEMANWENMDDKLYQQVATNLDAYRQLKGENNVDYRLKMGPIVRVANIPKITRQQREAVFHQVFPVKYKQYVDEFEMISSRGVNDEVYVNSVIAYLAKYDIQDSNQLNELAWSFYEMTDDQELLSLAKQWTEKSIELDPNFMNYDTLAAVCLKLKEKEEATKHALTAIKMAKEIGEDVSHTENLLKEIKKL